MARSGRGYFGVVAYHGKTTTNLGTLLRSANVFNAAFVGTIGARYHRQSSDTMQTPRHLPVFHWQTVEEFWAHIPLGCQPVGVEISDRARPISDWTHPVAAVYLLGPEDGSLPATVLDRCVSIVRLPGAHCLNVAVAGSVVMYDRIAKGERLHG